MRQDVGVLNPQVVVYAYIAGSESLRRQIQRRYFANAMSMTHVYDSFARDLPFTIK
jgi:hypothetical protein